jgi:hypothetical protein
MRPGAYLSTVTAAASSYNLVEIADLKTRLDVSGTIYDAYFALAIGDASTAAIAFMNNPIVVETLSDQIWPWRDSRLGAVRNREPTLQLKRWPIVAVASVVETIAGVATTLVAGTDYVVEPAKGWLTRLDPHGSPRNWNADPVVVAYSAGYATVPSDIQDAVSEMVKARWYARTRDPAVRAQNVEGVMSWQYWCGAGPGGDSDMPPVIQAKLQRYRQPVLA